MKFNLKAFLMHFLFSIALVSCFALIILSLWYPSIWSKALGGYDLFLKIVVIDLFAGPLCMGLVYKTHKRIREKILDIFVITTFQLAFLGYGLWILYESRPAFIVFGNQSFYVYVANEFVDEKEFGKNKPFDHLSLMGPIYAAIDIAKVDDDDKFDALFTGKDVTNIPSYYEPLETQTARILEVKTPYQKMKDSKLKVAIEQFANKHKLSDKNAISWLPVRHRFGFLTAVLYQNEIIPVGYIDLNPYDYLAKKEESNEGEEK